MNDKFQPRPRSTSAVQKCATEMPEIPTTAVAAINARPMPVMRSTPKRAISEPVTKLGAYIAAECRVGDGMTAADHRKRRRRHDHVHHGVARDAARDGDDEASVAHDLPERPRAIVVRRAERRHFDEL